MTTVNKYRRGKVKCGACQTLVAEVRRSSYFAKVEKNAPARVHSLYAYFMLFSRLAEVGRAVSRRT
jgi:hypothetical protein